MLAEVRAAEDEDDDAEAPLEERLAASYEQLVHHAKVTVKRVRKTTTCQGTVNSSMRARWSTQGHD